MSKRTCNLSNYRVTSHLVKHPDEIASEWLDLQGRSNCSYFQSWGWIGTWLEQVALDLQPVVVRVWLESSLIGLGVFVSSHIRRHRIIRSNAMFLHEYPFDDRDMIIEYNGLLVARNHEQSVYSKTVNHLFQTNRHCDEIFFSAMDGHVDITCLPPSEVKFISRVVEESAAQMVELDRFGQGVESYLATLSKNRRAQIRRSLRLYQELAPLKLREAGSIEEALLFFDGLKALHTERWRSKGRSGSFAKSRWEAYHRSLVRKRFSEREIGLLEISDTHGPVGYLYNFIWRDRVYVLQTGFRVQSDGRFMPGYVVHALAIAHYKNMGMKIYDLMHGDSLYKRMLCNRRETLRWVVMQRPRLKFDFENYVMNLTRITRNIMKTTVVIPAKAG
ncbi:MAG: GNAT family N-acetyltransferase [Gammaproteobacteria bacterium]